MELLSFLLVFVMFWKPSWSMLCYKCDATPLDRSYLNTKSCEHFDYSEEYQTECDSSTMCVKRVTTFTLQNGVTTTNVYRGCAPQTLSGDQAKINGKWRQVKKIYEAYEEKCAEDQSDEQRITKTTICYCRGDFCNSAQRAATIGIFVVLLGLLVMSL
ncbi:uncharacterized protein LOC115441307 [Manduca sexta]|uniref:uncharacterized protein LOC115441307 n=1 Tax=Manduca sexta TaxID=7130 RepID=UPI001183E63A|nr:uncharacterized protein LOC115441307 [Manduca sexta]